MQQISLINLICDMKRYFPIANMLSKTEMNTFRRLIIYIAKHQNFDLQLIAENKIKLTKIPNAARYLIAGHLAEAFFYRQNILERFLTQPRHFQIYTTPEAFYQDGGVAGGCYNPSRECIQIVISRLFEGFSHSTPGVCPFLHEFGHMLDFFDAGTGSMARRSAGLYPGLSPSDRDIYNPRARDLFIKGKRLELERYLARQRGDLTQPAPIGHPYVFQNDGEFAAGYLEMFFRNPHYFAEQNIDLFNAYVELFGYDTRQAWKEDFPHYVNANQKFYLSGQKPPQTKITIPNL